MTLSDSTRRVIAAALNKAADLLDTSRKDMEDAIEHADIYGDQGWTIDDFNVKSLGELPLARIRRMEDWSSWIDVDPSDFEGMSTEERLAELESFRGAAWAKRAASWLKDGVPPIIVISAPMESEDSLYQQIGDGRGRINFALAMGLKKLPVIQMVMKDKSKTNTVSSYLVNDVSSLKQYLMQPAAEKGREVADLMWSGFADWAEGKAPELHVNKDENWSEEVPDDVMEAFYDDVKYLNFYTFKYLQPRDLPSHVYLEYKRLVKDQWLIHFSNKTSSIARNGFTKGVSDITKLGLTTHIHQSEKEAGGFGFAFLASDAESGIEAAKNKYGDDAVMFRANGVLTYHVGDKEHQVIFLNSTAHDIVELSNSDGWNVSTAERTLFRGGDGSSGLKKCVEWVKNNYDQYRRQLTNSEPGRQVGATYGKR